MSLMGILAGQKKDATRARHDNQILAGRALARLRELQAEDSETARAAMELLERRGVTEAVFAEAERRLALLVTKPELKVA